MNRLFLTAAGCSLAAACATPVATSPVPDALRATAQERASFVRFARGVQIYRCDTAEGGAFKWTFVAPEAQLFESASAPTVLGTHGAGPFWQANDGSRIVGKVKARADAPTGAADIPWLLLGTTAEGPKGQMSAVTSIQRVKTVGGVAPAAGCSSAGDVGKQSRVPYTSDYVFFTAA